MTVQDLKDLQRKRVYQAERELTAQSQVFPDISAFSSFCRNLCKGLPPSFGNPKVPSVVEGQVPSNVAGLAYVDYGVWKIVMGKKDPKLALYGTHEIAHLLSHRWCELNDKPLEPHGPLWASVNLYLVWKHVDKKTAVALRSSYAQHGVRVGNFSDLL